MDLDIPPERRMLTETITRYLKDHYPINARNDFAYSDRGWSPEHWQRFAKLGVIGALFTEESDGFAGTGHDIAAVFEAIGQSLVVEPFLGTLMAGRALAAAGCTDLLKGMISGETVVVFAHEEPEGHREWARVATQAERDGDGWFISGTKTVVPQLSAADEVLITARTDGGLSLFLIDAQDARAQILDFLLIDGGRAGDLLLDRVPARLVGAEADGAALTEASYAAGLLALCAEAVGIMDSLRDQTLEFLRTRQQFGVPLGSFQALKHRMASLAVEIEQARSAVTNVAAGLDGERLTRERTASGAKFTIGRVGTLVAEEAIQLHGGIGMTWELPLSHLAKRLIMIGHQLGDEDHHLDRYIALRGIEAA